MDDRKILKEYQNGNKEYLNTLAEKYYDDIYRFCCYRTGNPDASYDLAQETFLRFIRYAQGNLPRNLKGYLLTIARNVCIDFFRKESSRQEEPLYPSDEFPELSEADFAGISSEDLLSRVIRDETSRELVKALMELPGMQREVIVLHSFYGLKYREIARITDSPPATVKSRMKQGMDKLKQVLRKEDFYGS